MQAALCPLDGCGFFASLCPHLKTASAVLHDGPGLTNADFRAAAEWPRISKTPGTARAAPVDGMPSDRLRANTPPQVEPRLSRLLLAARDLCDGKALPPIQEIPRTDDRRAAQAFQQDRLASDSRGQIEIIDVAGPRGVPGWALASL